MACWQNPRTGKEPPKANPRRRADPRHPAPGLPQPAATHKIIGNVCAVTERPLAHNLQLARGPLKQIIAVYPGSFDPVTNGHLDLIERGSKMFHQLIVGILRNREKQPLFSVAERRKMLEEMVQPFKNVRVDTFDGMMVDYAMSVHATAVLRGIRAISDYEYEFQMAMMNRKLQPALETIFMMPSVRYSFLSSRLVREIAQAGGSLKELVPDIVEERLRQKFDPAARFEHGGAARAGRQHRKQPVTKIVTTGKKAK